MFVLATTAPTNLGGYLFPAWADSLGWLVGTSTLTPFVIGVAYHLIKGDVSSHQLIYVCHMKIGLTFFDLFNSFSESPITVPDL